MKVVVGHHLWSRVGGTELVSAHVVKTLLDLNHEVIIASTSNFSKEKYKEWFGIDIDNVKIYSFLPKMLPMLGLYQRLLHHIPLKKAIKKERPDIVFIDNELYKPILNLRKKINFKILEYIHFPFHALRIVKGEIAREYIEAHENYYTDIQKYHVKYGKGLWKFYFNLWLKFYDMIARDNPFENADIVMCNSKYIAKLIKILWRGDAIVLYPPVRVNDFLSYNHKSFNERDNAVVMIGRISPEKGIENVINAIALTESKPILRIIGGLLKTNMPYKTYLEKLANEKGVKIEFYIDTPRNTLIHLAISSKVFVHATIGEHFGIAVVEGMAAGCPVIVHKSGGPYEDIIDYGNYGLYYESIEDLAEKIDRLLTDEKMWRYYHELSLKRALDFSEEVFKERFLGIIRKI